MKSRYFYMNNRPFLLIFHLIYFLSLRRGGDALSLQGKLFNLNKEP